MAFSSPEQQRAILSLSFEPAGDGFIYYHKAWSRGIPVTVHEREAYLGIPALGSRRAWRHSIANRQTVAPRPYLPMLHKLLAVMPIQMALVSALFGAASIVSGLSAGDSMLGLGYFVGGIVLAVFGVSSLIARKIPRQTEVR